MVVKIAMEAQSPPFMKSLGIVMAWTAGLAGVFLLCGLASRPLLLDITDQSGPFFLTLSPVDLDLDGDLDVLVHNRRQPEEFESYAGGTLWINQGGVQGGQAGEFTRRLNDIEGGWDSTTADLDGDGDPDVLIHPGYYLILGMNQGGAQGGQAGIFKQYKAIHSPQPKDMQFGTVVAGDINNDGRIDALVLGCCGRAFSFDEGPDIPNYSWAWLNQTNEDGWIVGEVTGLEVLDGQPVAEGRLGDLDGDGDLDLLAVILPSKAGAEAAPGGWVLWNDGAGRFSDSGQRLGGKGSSSVALGDLDGDGDLDALVGQARGAMAWINQGGAQGGQAGIFIAAGKEIRESGTHSVALADLDGDGDLDALLAGKKLATLWWNDGHGKFTQADQSFPSSDRQDLTTGDFNNDGREDIFIAGYDKESQVWMNDGKGGFE